METRARSAVVGATSGLVFAALGVYAYVGEGMDQSAEQSGGPAWRGACVVSAGSEPRFVPFGTLERGPDLELRAGSDGRADLTLRRQYTVEEFDPSSDRFVARPAIPAQLATPPVHEPQACSLLQAGGKGAWLVVRADGSTRVVVGASSQPGPRLPDASEGCSPDDFAIALGGGRSAYLRATDAASPRLFVADARAASFTPVDLQAHLAQVVVAGPGRGDDLLVVTRGDRDLVAKLVDTRSGAIRPGPTLPASCGESPALARGLSTGDGNTFVASPSVAAAHRSRFRAAFAGDALIAGAVLTAAFARSLRDRFETWILIGAFATAAVVPVVLLFAWLVVLIEKHGLVVF
jgi:hypothetical protein